MKSILMKFGGGFAFALACLPARVLADDPSSGPPPGPGFSLRTEVGWTLKIETATVSGVRKGSPAEKAGIAVGDMVTSVADCAIPGCGAYKAKGLMEKPPGGVLHMKFRRPSGEEYAVELPAPRGMTGKVEKQE